MQNDDLIKQFRQIIREEVEPIRKQLGAVQQDTAHISTAQEALRAGVEDVQAKQKEQVTKQDVEATVDAAKTELKADMLMLESKVVKKIQSHEKRISGLEEKTDTPNPDKN